MRNNFHSSLSYKHRIKLDGVDPVDNRLFTAQCEGILKISNRPGVAGAVLQTAL